ncbi:membrane alanyl aminopeptidase isoform X2 [Hermetia illucens]|nr:membrane alanyl aminopeptidase isoform X2 [Hermetia illucens]
MKQIYMLLCLLAVIVRNNGAAPASETTDSNRQAVDYRLPDTIQPSYYRLYLTPYLLESDGVKRFTFQGTVEITLRAYEANLKSIILHAKYITFSGTTLVEKTTGNAITIANQTQPDSITDKFSVNLASALRTDIDYVLAFNYTGQMRDDMRGFYRSKYVNAKGEEVYIGSTHFETITARRAFPCFDEPKFKAKFKLDITYPSQFNVVSNTLPESTVNIKTINTTITIFKETPIMSTYLLAFIVSDFRARGDKDFIVTARPEAYNQTEYAYNVGPPLLKNLETFTNYPYSTHGLGKMHLAGIPDFSAGAMENWGLLTYRETSLLYDTSASTLLNQQRVATVIAHELAHQWFGDLVTCDWWGYTWLNEAFGRYFQYFTTNEVEPTWELDKQFVVDQLQTVMNMDSLSGTTPMSDPTAATPEDLSRMFNSISYNKAATIMRMTKHMMTEPKFRAGLQKYLKNNEFKTAVPQDLFNAFDENYSGLGNISSILKDWTEQVGYPVITIKLANNGKAFNVSQKRFLLRSDAGDASLLYQIPLTYTTDVESNFENTNTKALLPKSTSEVTIDLGNQSAKWIIANIQEVGYYRVNYDDTIWDNIRKALVSANHGKIHELNRAQIVDDVFNLGRAGLLKYERVIQILEYLKSETNYLPWYAAFQGYSYLAVRLGVPNEKYFKPYILGLLDNAYKSVGFTYNQTEKRLVTYNRANVLSWACKYGHTNCVKQSKDIYKSFMDESKPVEVNIRAAVYCTAIREGGEQEFNFLWNKYRGENVQAEQVTILTALGCSSNKTQLHKYLDLILSDAVRLQDRQTAFSGTYTSSAENVNMVWEYVQDNYKKIQSSFDSWSTLASIISGIASRFTTEEQRKSLQTFVDNHKTEFGSSASTLTSALDNVAFNIKWATESMKPFVDHLKSVGDSATTIPISTVLVLVTSYFVAFLFN